MWNLQKDPYYGSANTIYRSQKMMRDAGFFPHAETKRSDSKLWLSTPFYKILTNISGNTFTNKRPVILVTSGGLSPVHQGHIDMMDQAAECLQKHGRIVVGGYISPSHDRYVWYTKRQKVILPSAYRIRLCELAVSKHPWLMVDTWESRYNIGAVNFSEVLLYIEQYLAQHIPAIKFDVYYVFGSDNASFARAFVMKGGCVCVRRGGYEKEFINIQTDRLVKNTKQIFFTMMHKSSSLASSSAIINGNYRHHIPYVKQECIFWNQEQNAKTLYYMLRNDTAYAISNWKKYSLDKQTHAFYRKLYSTIKKALTFSNSIEKCKPVQLQSLSVKKQQRYIDKLLRKHSIINIDVCTKGGYPLRVSRVFEISGGQCQSLSIAPRPGAAALKDQLQKIPIETRVLVDDDIVKGHMYHKNLQALLTDFRIHKYISLMNEMFDKPIYDVVDARDFLVGSRDGGLVVTLPNGTIARVPYLLPYVSLVSRAKFSPSQEYSFSVALWKANKYYYSSITPPITVQYTDRSFQEAMLYIGFAPDTNMVDICSWHLRMLLAYDV